MATIQLANDGITILNADSETAGVLGIPADNLVGKLITSIVWPEDREAFEVDWKKEKKTIKTSLRHGSGMKSLPAELKRSDLDLLIEFSKIRISKPDPKEKEEEKNDAPEISSSAGKGIQSQEDG